MTQVPKVRRQRRQNCTAAGYVGAEKARNTTLGGSVEIAREASRHLLRLLLQPSRTTRLGLKTSGPRELRD